MPIPPSRMRNVPVTDAHARAADMPPAPCAGVPAIITDRCRPPVQPMAIVR